MNKQLLKGGSSLKGLPLNIHSHLYNAVRNSILMRFSVAVAQNKQLAAFSDTETIGWLNIITDFLSRPQNYNW